MLKKEIEISDKFPAQREANGEIDFSQKLKDLRMQEEQMLHQLNQTKSIQLNDSKEQNLLTRANLKNDLESENMS